jgi:hypothetical protein
MMMTVIAILTDFKFSSLSLLYLKRTRQECENNVLLEFNNNNYNVIFIT